MKIRTLLSAAAALVLTVGSAHIVVGQSSVSGDVEADHDRRTMPDGILRLNGVLYVVSAGAMHRIDLADGQMATLDGVIRRLPANFKVPAAGVTNGSTTSGTTAGPASTSDRDRSVKDPTPGSSTPSQR